MLTEKRHWIATVTARCAGAPAQPVVLATFRFQAPAMYTPDHLHGWSVGRLLRLYGQRLAARKLPTATGAEPPEVLVNFAPDPARGRTRRLDNLIATLERAMPDRPGRHPPVISFGDGDDEDIDEGPDDDLYDLSLPRAAIEPFADADQARADKRWSDAEHLLRSLLASWQQEPASDRRAMALARLLVVALSAGHRAGMPIADQLAMDLRSLAMSNAMAARRVLPPLRNILLEGPAHAARRRALSAVRSAYQIATRLSGAEDIPPW
jgi:hypothetical protein